MLELFVKALFGHLIGDFFVQPKAMAIAKGTRGWNGFWWCTLHVLVYTVVVCLHLSSADPLVWALVFVPHWLIDRYSLGMVILRATGGRTFEAAHASTSPYREFDIAFTSIVYTVVDATLHLMCLWWMLRFIAQT